MKKLLLFLTLFIPSLVWGNEYLTKEVTVTEAGTLQTAFEAKYTDGQKYQLNKLIVHGPINGADWKFIKETMVPYDISTNPFEKRMFIDLTDASLVADNTTWKTKDGTGQIKKDNVVPAYFLSRKSDSDSHLIGTIALPNSATHIATDACFDAMALNYVFIGKQTKVIGKEAFRANPYLRAIYIPTDNCLDSIGTNAFNGNSANTNFAVAVIPQHVSYVADYVFYNRTGISSIYVMSAPTFENMLLTTNKPTEVHFMSTSTSVPSFRNNTIQLASNGKVYVPVGMQSAYKKAFGTRVYKTSGKTLDDADIVETYFGINEANGSYYRTWSDAEGTYRELPESGLSAFYATSYTGNTDSKSETEGTVTLSPVTGAIPYSGCVLKSTQTATTFSLGGKDVELMIIAGMTKDVDSNGKQCAVQKLNETLTAEMQRSVIVTKDCHYVKAPTTTTAASTGTNYFVGSGDNSVSVAPVTKDGDNISKRNFVLSWYGSDPKLGFYRTKEGTLAAHKAYLALPASMIGNVGGADVSTSTSSAKALGIVFADATTGIRTMVNNQKTDNGYYTLQGIKVARPTKGLFIHNGKKVIIK